MAGGRRQKEEGTPHGERRLGSSEKPPLVGIGASAGGLAPLKRFFSQVAPDSGVAYLVLVHSAGDNANILPEILQRVTSIEVTSPSDGQVIEPNRVYVAPPDEEVQVFGGKLHLLEKLDEAESLPIDRLFHSIAQDAKEKAAAIVLSGTGRDGSLGIREITANDGLVLVQSMESTEYEGMPKSALDTGLVDVELRVEEMPQKLVDWFSHRRGGWRRKDAPARVEPGDDTEWLNKVFAVLRSRLGYDFSVYKKNTLRRRIDRRMGLNDTKDYKTYLRFLRQDKNEVQALFREMLIGVTSFFRDPESFVELREKALPHLFDRVRQDGELRVWVPGCSTGEEVYSLAMALHEFMDTCSKRVNVQLFGTDIDERAVEKARRGVYPEGISADVGTERLKRFFANESGHYRVCREIRNSVVFSVQDVLNDPPFSRLDLLCCRNLLIYFDSDSQKRLLPLFHYTLKPGGYLMLGSSETIGGFSSLFEPVDKKWKIYKRAEVPKPLAQGVDFPSGGVQSTVMRRSPTLISPRGKENIETVARETLLERITPPAVLVSASDEILYVQGRVGKYLEPPSGPPTSNVLDQAREGLRIELSSALRRARASGKDVVRRSVVVASERGSLTIDLHVLPLKSVRQLEKCLLVVFKDPLSPPSDETKGKGPAEEDLDGAGVEAKVAELERELQLHREDHQTTVEELESSNEELKSTNEELQSSNEELQSSNEELESSKEELQSLNEELHTLNSELQSKVEELSMARDDMRNLLNSTEIATVFVDKELRVRRFTEEASQIINLIQTDLGRPLDHVKTNLRYEEMIKDLSEVVDKLTPKTREVQSTEGEWFNMRIVPYRTMDNRIDGAVVTFSNIQEQKDAQNKLQQMVETKRADWQLLRSVFDMIKQPMTVVDEHGKVIIANSAFIETFFPARGLEETIVGSPLLAAEPQVLIQEELRKEPTSRPPGSV